MLRLPLQSYSRQLLPTYGGKTATKPKIAYFSENYFLCVFSSAEQRCSSSLTIFPVLLWACCNKSMSFSTVGPRAGQSTPGRVSHESGVQGENPFPQPSGLVPLGLEGCSHSPCLYWNWGLPWPRCRTLHLASWTSLHSHGPLLKEHHSTEPLKRQQT